MRIKDKKNTYGYVQIARELDICVGEVLGARAVQRPPRRVAHEGHVHLCGAPGRLVELPHTRQRLAEAILLDCAEEVDGDAEGVDDGVHFAGEFGQLRGLFRAAEVLLVAQKHDRVSLLGQIRQGDGHVAMPELPIVAVDREATAGARQDDGVVEVEGHDAVEARAWLAAEATQQTLVSGPREQLPVRFPSYLQVCGRQDRFVVGNGGEQATVVVVVVVAVRSCAGGI